MPLRDNTGSIEYLDDSMWAIMQDTLRPDTHLAPLMKKSLLLDLLPVGAHP